MKCEVINSVNRTFVIIRSEKMISVNVLELKNGKPVAQTYNAFSDMPQDVYDEMRAAKMMRAKLARQY